MVFYEIINIKLVGVIPYTSMNNVRVGVLKAGMHNTLCLNGKFKELMCCYAIALNYCVIMKTTFLVLNKAMGRKAGIHNTLYLNRKFKS